MNKVKFNFWLYGCCISSAVFIASHPTAFKKSDNLNKLQVTLCSKSFHLQQFKDHRQQESAYESQQWWQSTKRWMVQCMLGTSLVQDSPMYPRMHCSMNIQCSWIVWFYFILTICSCFLWLFSSLFCDVQRFLWIFCWLSPLLRIIHWFFISVCKL